MTDQAKPKPKYQYDGLLRAKGLDRDDSGGIKVIKIDEHYDKVTWCPNCKHSMELDEQIDCYVCDDCGNILSIKLGDAPLQEEQVLHTSNDPYGSDSTKPIFTTVNVEYADQYEDLGRRIYESAEEAMSERRVKRNGKKQRIKT